MPAFSFCILEENDLDVVNRRDEVETFNEGGYSLTRFYRSYDPSW